MAVHSVNDPNEERRADDETQRKQAEKHFQGLLCNFTARLKISDNILVISDISIYIGVRGSTRICLFAVVR